MDKYTQTHIERHTDAGTDTPRCTRACMDPQTHRDMKKCAHTQCRHAQENKAHTDRLTRSLSDNSESTSLSEIYADHFPMTLSS